MFCFFAYRIYVFPLHESWKYVFMQCKGSFGLDSVSVELQVNNSRKSDWFPRYKKLSRVQEDLSPLSKQWSVKVCQTSFKAVRHKRTALNNQSNSWIIVATLHRCSNPYSCKRGTSLILHQWFLESFHNVEDRYSIRFCE